MEREKSIKIQSPGGAHSLGQLAMRRLKRNRLAVAGVAIIALAALISVLGSWLRPDASVNANEQMLQIARQKPGFSVDVALITRNTEIESTPFWRRLFLGGKVSATKAYPIHSYFFEDDELVIEEYNGRNKEIRGREMRFHLADVVWPLADQDVRTEADGTIIATAVDGSQHRALKGDLQAQIEASMLTRRTYWLGTDKFGRDLLSRLMGGTFVSLSVGLISVLISLVIGISLGAVAGYFRGWVDELIMWLINVMWSVPTLLLVMAITLALGKGFVQVFIAVGLTMWVEVARVVRGQVISLREQEFVEAGHALGFRAPRIIGRHILPNVMAPVIVLSAANFASAILIEAGLSFLGIGAQIPMPSWGQMIKEHYSYITTDLAYLAVLPGVCIMLLVLAFMLV
ncbi:MAG: ABC transporter permease, partial [Cryomorphaceae bacterium]